MLLKEGRCPAKAEMKVYLHRAQRPRNFSPNSVYILVEGLQGVDLEFGLLVGEEGKHPRGGDEAGHGEAYVSARMAQQV